MLIIVNFSGANVPSSSDDGIDDVIGRYNVSGLVLITVQCAHDAHGGTNQNPSGTIDIVYETSYWFFSGSYNCKMK